MGEVKEIRAGVFQHVKEGAAAARKLVQNIHALGGESAMMIVMEGKKYLILVEEVQE
jgi:hypothetical protein